MTWLRRRPDPVDEGAVAEVASALESAAAAAPPSPREMAIREALLEGLATREQGGTVLRPMAFVATVLVAFLVVAALPQIASYLGALTDRTTASPTAPASVDAGDKAASTIAKPPMVTPPQPSTSIDSPEASASPSPDQPASERRSPDATPTIAPATPTEPPLSIPTLPVTPTLPPPPVIP